MKGSYLGKKNKEQPDAAPAPSVIPAIDFIGSYLCDPNNNFDCAKENCVLRGGSCFSTKDIGLALSGYGGTPEMLTPERFLNMQLLVRRASKSEDTYELQSR